MIGKVSEIDIELIVISQQATAGSGSGSAIHRLFATAAAAAADQVGQQKSHGVRAPPVDGQNLI